MIYFYIYIEKNYFLEMKIQNVKLLV